MAEDRTATLLAEAVAQLERTGEARHRELMRTLEEIVAQLDKIERTQYG